jgi:hypothetical protein
MQAGELDPLAIEPRGVGQPTLEAERPGEPERAGDPGIVAAIYRQVLAVCRRIVGTEGGLEVIPRRPIGPCETVRLTRP